jgi:ketosteroid isomerase-like protein
VEATEVMQAYAAAWERGDPEAAFEWYADDVVMRLPGRSRESGVHRGKPAVIGAINALLDRTGDHSVVVEVLQRLESPSCVALEFVRSGSVATRGWSSDA